ncbi:unnamed protein product, partial [Amoebophrya sp. A25]|eukprot:GSA25T00024512001.1
MAYPWGVWDQTDLPSGPPKCSGHYYSSYMITFSCPTDAFLETHPNAKRPVDVTDEEYIEILRNAHQSQGTDLKIMGIRREKARETGHLHLHAAVTAGNSKKRFGWQQASSWAKTNHGIYLHYSSCMFQAGIHYLFYASSKKHSFEFTDEMKMYWAPEMVPCDP